MTEAQIMIQLLEQSLERLDKIEKGLVHQPEQLKVMSQAISKLSEADAQRESFQLKMMTEQRQHMQTLQASAAKMAQAQEQEIERLSAAVLKLEEGSQAAQRFGREAVEISRFLNTKTLGASMLLGSLAGVLSSVFCLFWVTPQLSDQISEQLAIHRKAVLSQCVSQAPQVLSIEEPSKPKAKSRTKSKVKPK